MNKSNAPIIFFTSNDVKFKNFESIVHSISPHCILRPYFLDIPEIQSLDMYEVARQKAELGWSIIQRPLIIEEGGLFLAGYHNFPGALTKHTLQGIGISGTWKLAQRDPVGFFKSCLVYIDGPDSIYYFEALWNGHFIDPETIIPSAKATYSDMFVPHGETETLSTILKKRTLVYPHKQEVIAQFLAWLDKGKERSR